MNQRENLLNLFRRRGFESIPVSFDLCESQIETYRQREKAAVDYQEFFGMPWRTIPLPVQRDENLSRFEPYHPGLQGDDFTIDWVGVGHRKTPSSMHMTQMYYPLRDIDSVEQIEAYPFPEYDQAQTDRIKAEVDAIKASGCAAKALMNCTIWETSWYLRGMENLMMDMMTEDPMAQALLDRVTDLAVARGRIYAAAGADILHLGDDIGMQRTIMMSLELYRDWLKPRLIKVIQAARAINPDILIFYHSCGYIEPFIPDLIEAGVDILNPIQPECMSFEKVFSDFGGAISFHGTIGTQTVMPFGSPEDVTREVRRNLDIAGAKGGLMPAPTHMVEPEVPWENIWAYVKACREYRA